MYDYIFTYWQDQLVCDIFYHGEKVETHRMRYSHVRDDRSLAELRFELVMKDRIDYLNEQLNKAKKILFNN